MFNFFMSNAGIFFAIRMNEKKNATATGATCNRGSNGHFDILNKINQYIIM